MGTVEYQQTESWMWRIGIKSTAKIIIFGVIYELSKDDGFCEISLSDIANSFHINKRTVVRCVNHLEKEGFIYKETVPSEKGGKINRYRINTELVEEKKSLIR